MSTVRWRIVVAVILVAALVLPSAAVVAKGGPPGGGGGGGGGGHPEGGEADVAGNNLSYPVIWAEGVTKTLRGAPGTEPILDGEWWYQWGTNGVDPDIVPASCPPDPDNEAFCDDIVSGTYDESLKPGEPAADNSLPLAKAYLQKDLGNVWLAGTDDWSGAHVNVHWIDWGDNLESVDWYTRSQVRTEVVLFQDLATPMLEYEMRHTDGWGIDEVHGMAVDQSGVVLEVEGTRATVYSHCARLTIQRLLVDRDDPNLSSLVWVPGDGWTEPEGVPDDLINPHIFNGSVHEGGDGPGYYSAEINVKGRIIYGYTWNVKQLNEGAGDYRITFSFDQVCGSADLNTYFDGSTQILVPLEEEEEIAALEETEGSDTGGGTPVLVPVEFDDSGGVVAGNLTYVDVRILERTGGGGGGGGNGGRGGGGDAITASAETLSVECPPDDADCDRLQEQDQDRIQDQECDCTDECRQECECCQDGACDPNCDCPCNCEQSQEQEQAGPENGSGEQNQEREQEQAGPGSGSGEQNQNQNQNQEREQEGSPEIQVYLPLMTSD